MRLIDCRRQHRFPGRGRCNTIGREPLTAATRSSLAACVQAVAQWWNVLWLCTGYKFDIESIVVASLSQSNFCQWHTFQNSPVPRGRSMTSAVPDEFDVSPGSYRNAK